MEEKSVEAKEQFREDILRKHNQVEELTTEVREMKEIIGGMSPPQGGVAGSGGSAAAPGPQLEIVERKRTVKIAKERLLLGYKTDSDQLASSPQAPKVSKDCEFFSFSANDG